MHLLLRCDACPSTGVGHAVRCLALAEAARASGHDVTWSGQLDAVGWLRADLAGSTVLPREDTPGRLAALTRDVGADTVHVDHYTLPSALRGPLEAAGVALSNIEDAEHGRRPADVVVDPNLDAGAQPRPADGSRIVLRGLEYALLRPAVIEARRVRATAPASGGQLRVLVVMGGTDAAGLLDPVLAALDAAALPAEVDVIVPAGRDLRPFPAGPVRLYPSQPRADLPQLMARADLVISAAGTTVWELCCIGAPMALVRAADNQTSGYAAVVAAGAAVGLGGPDDLADTGATAAAVHALLTDAPARALLGQQAARLVDGSGASRVVTAIEGVLGSALSAVRVRRAAPADAELLFRWRNDEATRRWSRSPEVVDWGEHIRWFEASLAREGRLLLILDDAAGVPVGTVRWDRQRDGEWEVSITLAPSQRGRGLAAMVLRAGEEELIRVCGAGVLAHARVYVSNTASRKLFSRGGYDSAGPPDGAGLTPYRKLLS